MSRKIQDALLSATKALPAAAASAATDPFDLGETPWPTVERIDAQLSCPDLPALVEDKTATFAFEDSADGDTFAPIAELSTVVLTGGVGDGATGFTRTVALPPAVRRYVRASCDVLTAGGNNTAVSFTFKLLF